MEKVYVVPHTHWDKEWYFSTKDACILSEQIFKDAIDFLEEDENLTFCMDGQYSIIEDFLNVRPEYRKKFEKLVKTNQLELGPWYTQTDCINVDGESIVRNLVYGIYKTNKIGMHMKIAYLPDTFGFNSQMPLIINQVGIDKLVFRRGGEYGENKLQEPLFLWKTKNNSVAQTLHIIGGYDLGAKFTDDKEYINGSLAKNLNRIKELTPSDIILCPCGNDQLNLNPNLTTLVDNVNKYSKEEYKITTFAKYFEDTKQYYTKEYSGDLRFPEYDRVHLTIGSVRADIKKTNFWLEQKIFKVIEPLMVLAKQFDIDVSVNLLYKVWERIFESAAHDGMGGCVTDSVYEDIMYRYKESKEILEGIENTITNKLSQKLELNENQLLVFNLMPYKFNGIKEVEYFAETKNVIVKEAKSNSITEIITYSAEENELINNDDVYYLIKSQIEIELPAFGFKVLNLEKSEKEIKNEICKINTGVLEVSVENGTLKLVKDGMIINDFITFVDIGNDGDTYDFSPLENDKPIKSKLISSKFYDLSKTQMAQLKYELNIPYSLEDRLVNENLVNQIVDVTLFAYDDERIKVKINFDNKVLSHRLSLLINTGSKIKTFNNSVPFGIDELTYENRSPKVDSNYIEYDVENFVFDQFVNFKIGTERFMTIASYGTKEFYIDDEKVNIPLIATTGLFGKSNLLYRPGRASGDTSKKGHIVFHTPLAQLMGENEFVFDVYLKQSELDCKQVCEINENMAPDCYYQSQVFNKFHYRIDNKIQKTESKSLYETEVAGFELSGNVQIKTITPSLYDTNTFLVRLYNPFGNDEKFAISKYKDVEIVNAIEDKMENQKLVVEAYSIKTIKIKLNEK